MYTVTHQLDIDKSMSLVRLHRQGALHACTFHAGSATKRLAPYQRGAKATTRGSGIESGQLERYPRRESFKLGEAPIRFVSPGGGRKVQKPPGPVKAKEGQLGKKQK